MKHIKISEQDSALVEKYFVESKVLLELVDILSKNIEEGNKMSVKVVDKYAGYYKNSKSSLEVAKTLIFQKYLPGTKVEKYSFDFSNCELYYE